MKNIYNIERNKLDYILTDIMPVELTELFSFSNFYDYLIKNKKDLDKISKVLLKNKVDNKNIMFNSGWNTMPLKYDILKGLNGNRELNLVQPFSALNIYFFIELYQKELLMVLEEKACFSLRYHKKNSNLYYKSKTRHLTKYFGNISKKIKKAALQQTGVYFKIGKYNSLSSFTSSKTWQYCNQRYRYFAKIDYKSCFNSIYSHTYKWIVSKDVVVSRKLKNSNIYSTIDRIVQNINASSSNGIIVGPEFSRMIAEILLQHIDHETLIRLEKEGLVKSADFKIFRYVDDIYIFANNKDNLDMIIKTFEYASKEYLLKFNENKILIMETPFILNDWLNHAKSYSDSIANLFHSDSEIKNQDTDIKHILKDGFITVDRLKLQFNSIMCEFPDDRRYIVSYALTTILNQVSRRRESINIFSKDDDRRVIPIIELILYLYSFCTCFEHAQKVISILVYIQEESGLKDESHKTHSRFQKIWNQYSYLFEKGSLNDLCNWFLFFNEYKIYIPTVIEEKIVKRIVKENNPLLWANYLIYSEYDTEYKNSLLNIIEPIIRRETDKIDLKEIMLHKEFWYVIVFFNCPFISDEIRIKLLDIISNLEPVKTHPSDDTRKVLYNYMKQTNPSTGKPYKNMFYIWGYYEFSTSKQIAYRTNQRSVFKNYKKGISSSLYGSID